MRILVTGATGFLGRHVVERLRGRDEVLAFVRRADPSLEVPCIEGDVTDAATLAGAAEGCEAVIHAAGMVSQRPEDARTLMDLHVTGTTNVLAEARRAGVRRVVYLSTSGTVAVSEREDALAREDSPTPMPILMRWPYYRSKLFAEQAALAAHGQGLSVISLNPSLLLGPGDPRGESVKSVRMFLEDQVPVCPPGGLSFADVRDVAATVETALHRGEGGRRYLLGAVNLSFAEYYRKLARLTGLQAPALVAPAFTRRALTLFPEWGKEGFGFGMTVDRVSMEQACHFWSLDDRRARAELGWAPRDPVATLRDTVADLLQRSKGMRLPSAP